MLEGDGLFVAWNASLRCSESDIRMDICGRKVLFCDIRLSGSLKSPESRPEVAC